MYESTVEWLSVEHPDVRSLLSNPTEDQTDRRFDWLGRYDTHLEDWINKPAQVGQPSRGLVQQASPGMTTI